MIGNDIVDLSIARVGAGTRRTRYLKKIYTEEEIDLINNSNNEDLMIWLMWSLKESVYKIIVRREKKIRYAPKSICCKSVISLQNDSYQSTVLYNGSTFTSISTIKGDCIHTIAFDDQEIYPQIKSASFESTKSEDTSLFLDNKVIDTLKNSQNNLEYQFVIKRDKLRIPHVYKNDTEIALLSLSHHGRFSGYAYLNLPNK